MRAPSVRQYTVLALAAALAIVAPRALTAAEPGAKQHALSLIGPPKFGPDFKHFDWVNPNAPKGGTLRLAVDGSFDSLNDYTVKGDPASISGWIYDSLFTRSLDEPSTEYALIAEWIRFPADFSSATFGIRASARFHDGRAITPEDVIFSLEQLKKNHPLYNSYYKHVVKAEQTGEREVTFTFDAPGNRELPQIVSELPILPKHYWSGKDAKGEPRDLGKTTLEIPLGSGPFKVKSVDPGRQIVLERVKDYWAQDLPVRRGQYNFDELHTIYFRDSTPAFEAFKSGSVDLRNEHRAKAWAVDYDFPALRKGLVKKHLFPQSRVAGMQGFAMNLRRPQFKDARVRQAMNFAFDFETANRNLFYGIYIRTNSYFDNSELAARALPVGRELAILEEVRSLVPPEVFTTPWANPTSKSPADARRNLGEAVKLLTAAGYTPKNGVMTAADGKTLTFEFLLSSPDFERIVLPYKQALDQIGIKTSLRVVDPAQYKRRVDTFDFDVVVGSWGQSLSPGNEQRDFWGSGMADVNGSRNLMGIKNPAIDKLIDRVVFAKDREELVAATNALDRVLLWNHYVVPQWHFPFARIAAWDMFGIPEKVASQSVDPVRTWWIDPDKLKALTAARAN